MLWKGVKKITIIQRAIIFRKKELIIFYYLCPHCLSIPQDQAKQGWVGTMFQSPIVDVFRFRSVENRT